MTRTAAISSSFGLALVALAVGCEQRDATQLEGMAGRDSGGGPAALAGAGGSGGGSAGGAAGSLQGPLPNGGVARLRALRVTSLDIERVHIQALDPAWILTCESTPHLVQRVNEEWVPLRDDRPPLYNLLHERHYVDGILEPQSCVLSNGCDVVACEALPEDESGLPSDHPSLRPEQYVQVGTLPAYACLPDAGEPPPLDVSDAGALGDAGLITLPDLRRRSPEGPLGVRIRYFRDSQCLTGPITVVVPVEG